MERTGPPKGIRQEAVVRLGGFRPASEAGNMAKAGDAGVRSLTSVAACLRRNDGMTGTVAKSRHGYGNPL